MDKATAKLLLESMRPQDAGDPIFAEALREVAADPELAAWFADLQHFDTAIGAKLREIEVPSDVKEHVLRGYAIRTAPPVKIIRMPQMWSIPMALAAAFVIGLFTWHELAPPPKMHSLEMQAIAYSKDMPALQFVCFDANAVAGWINQQPAAQQVGLKLPMMGDAMKLKMIGASMTQWNGKPVVMVCLQNGRQMALLYIMNGDAAASIPEGMTETMQHGEWVVRATKVDGQVRLLAAKGTPQDLDFPMPFTQGA